MALQSNNQTITPQIYQFSNKLWDFKSENLNESICEILQSNLEIDEKMKNGFKNLEKSLKIYLELLNLSIESFSLTIFGSITIENEAIIRATNKYHNKPWFSDIAIMMNSEELFDYITDKGICYGQVIILCKLLQTFYRFY
jgi:hypothetical protein